MAQRRHLVLVHFQVFLFQEVNRTIAEPILEQLQGLSILVSEIDRYTSVVERLKSLEQLWFTLNDVFDYRPYTIDDDGPTLAFAFAVDIGGTGSQEEAMRTMIDFLKSHARLFQGSTQDSDLYRWRVLVHLPTVLSPEVSFEMLQIESEFKRLGDERGRFLQRCRRLRGLRSQSLGPGSPNWAVQEKRAAIGERQGGNGQGALSIEMGRPAYLEHGLAPIEQVYIHEDRAPFQKEVYDIMFAFSQTLTNFEANVLDGPPASL
ncbi:hypothetical protein BGX23_011169 [Mortierella sp. AD031]|nr:hypothetical protein BGX23_011169 [Mortierella sp. AD031]